MNQPASKEPTMDEILSSIRQIIADDDEAAARKTPVAEPAPARLAPVAAAPEPRPTPVPSPAPSFDEMIDPFADDEDDAVSPLTLTPDQIVPEAKAATPEPQVEPEPEPAPEPEPEPEITAPAPRLVSDTVRPAETDRVVEPEPELEPESMPAAAAPEPAAPEESGLTGADLVDPDDVAFESDEPLDEPANDPTPHVPPHRPRLAQAAPLPDPDLTRDLAEELLEPATGAAVRNAFSRLNAPRLTPDTPVGGAGLTIESMLREMLRPMLKDWLDENLPSMVERIVEQEIERVSRGGKR